MAKRRFPRYPLDRPLKAVLYWDDIQVRKIHGQCLVISEGGMGARLYDQVCVGEVIRIDMAPLPSVYATVRNCSGNQYGLEFLYSQPGQRQAVTGVCTIADDHEQRPAAGSA